VFESSESIRKSLEQISALCEENEGKSGWQIATKITETFATSFETSEQMVIGAQKLANAATNSANNIIKESKVGGVALGALRIVITAGDGLTNSKGWQNHHTADLIISGGEILLGIFEYTSPIGWAFGAGMFIGNLITEHYTGKTITENLFDKEP
jgi:hypothetical protein